MSISLPQLARGATLGLGVLLALGVVARPARGEVLQLVDNTQVAGRILHFYEGVFQVETAGGERVDVPRDKIKQITFKLPPPRPEFSTPEKTFHRWNEMLQKGDLAHMIDCYALMYQGMLGAQLSQSEDEWKKMRKDIEGTRLEVKGTKITGDTAQLKVQRTKGDDVATADIRLVLENGEWKMTP